MKILVTAINGDLAEAVCRTLREAFPGVSIAGTEISDCFWPGLSYTDTVFPICRGESPHYIENLMAIVKAYGAEMVIPLSEAEILKLSRSPNILGVPVLVNAAYIVEPFLDKFITNRWLAEHGFSVPKTYFIDDVTEFCVPVILKPRFGSGSRGIHVARQHSEMVALRSMLPSTYVAQEFIDVEDAEHTCALFRHRGETRSIIMLRKLMGGMSREIKIVNPPGVKEMLERLAVELNLDGAINVQMRLRDGIAYIFEINPRLSSTVRMRHLVGFCDLQWLVEAATNRPIGLNNSVIGTTVYRMSREVLVSAF